MNPGVSIRLIRCVYQVDSIALPVAEGKGGVDGDLTVYLLGLEIRDRIAGLYGAPPVDGTGVVEHGLHQGGFPGSRVGCHCDVPKLLN
jgi:hypothetical protein